MSYSRSFTKRIAVHYSGTVNCPPSEKGTSVSYSGTVYEDVHVNVEVDTTSFDQSVDDCNSNVGILTGSVVATETAQTASIRNNAIKVGDTIINGFFKTVRSEISQQIMELKNRIDATLLHLNSLSKRCIEKQKQMEVDYQRLTGQYMRIFNDLNNELKNRIYELDKPVFLFRQESDKSAYRTLNSDMVTTVAVSGAENSKLEAMIHSSVAKRTALRAIGVINTFLNKQKSTDDILYNSIRNEAVEGVYYIPVCYLETNDSNNRINRKIYQSDKIPTNSENTVIDRFMNMDIWKDFTGKDAEMIRLSFNDEVSKRYNDADAHAIRVRDYMIHMFKNNYIQTI